MGFSRLVNELGVIILLPGFPSFELRFVISVAQIKCERLVISQHLYLSRSIQVVSKVAQS